MNDKDIQGIWVLAEVVNGHIHPSTFELLGKAHDLQKGRGDVVTAVLLEPHTTQLAEQLIAYGADEVRVIRHDAFRWFNDMVMSDAVVSLVNKYHPSILMVAATYQGRALAPRIQGALQTGLTADCLDLSINEQGQLVQIKPSYGDNLMCTILIPESRPQMTTVRPNVFRPREVDHSRQGVITVEPFEVVFTGVYDMLASTPINTAPDSLSDAPHVVAVGRGIKSMDNRPVFDALAKTLNAKIGATRPLAENGWYPIEDQIGQSGVTIQPELILNFGISGAVQYTVGMKHAGFVVSVNTDKEASLFKESDYGYIGDATAFAQALNKVLNKQ